MKELHILVTNDDGIHAEGIQYLSQVLQKEGHNLKLSIVAPDRERSAIGHAITMHQPLRVEKISFMHNRELSGWSVNGTPSDCVKLAVEAILESKPDLVISGINRGSNLGTDVLYSGTVSAAVEGLIIGIPSVAVSLTDRGEEKNYLYAARYVRNLIPDLLESGIEPHTLININIPVNTDQIKGVRITSLGNRRYRNIFDRRIDPRGSIYYWMAGEVVDDDPEDDHSDTKAIRENYISVTPVCFRLTDFEAMPKLHKMLTNVQLPS